jgi:transposase
MSPRIIDVGIARVLNSIGISGRHSAKYHIHLEANMQTILHNCCGLDIHKDSVVACIIKTRESFAPECNQEDVTKEIRVFKTFHDDLAQLRNWLESENCCHVAMESTGVYWYPVFDALENSCGGKMEIFVTNARHMRNVPGKKTDIKDAEWIASLLRAGLLRGSFIPPVDVRELRQLTRYRKNVVGDINTQKNRIEKSLQQAGFKLSSFLSDIFGVSGRNLIRVLIQKGILTPKDVENETRCISSAKKHEIKIAINGRLSVRQRQFLHLQITLLDELLGHLSVIEQSIEELSKPFTDEIARLDTIPGVAETAATAIIAEIGTDMSKFPTAEHFCSWAGVVPGDNKSAGKKKVPE